MADEEESGNASGDESFRQAQEHGEHVREWIHGTAEEQDFNGDEETRLAYESVLNAIRGPLLDAISRSLAAAKRGRSSAGVHSGDVGELNPRGEDVVIGAPGTVGSKRIFRIEAKLEDADCAGENGGNILASWGGEVENVERQQGSNEISRDGRPSRIGAVQNSEEVREEGDRTTLATIDLLRLISTNRTRQKTTGRQSDSLTARRQTRASTDQDAAPMTPTTTSNDDTGGESEPAEESEAQRPVKRRKVIGGLRLSHNQEVDEPNAEQNADVTRRLKSNARQFPQRRQRESERPHTLQPSSVDRFVVGIWEQIHSNNDFTMELNDQWQDVSSLPMIGNQSINTLVPQARGPPAVLTTNATNTSFRSINNFCRQVTQASRCCRALEVVVQAQWVHCFDERTRALAAQRNELSLTKSRMVALGEACADFGWSEKELRNKLAIWRGYKELQEAGGWVCLVFAGMGLYRFCKYRVGFNEQSMSTLKRLRTRFEVAADTIHPGWRRLLAVVGESSDRVYHGHPHDWVVNKNGDPVPLASTYVQWNPNFTYEHIEESVMDEDA